jgi:hypothetical protein
MLAALHAALGDFSRGVQDLLPILVQPEKLKLFPFYVYPVWIWGFLRGAKTLAADDPAFFTRGADTIQSMLTMILYFGQPSVYAQALKASKVTPDNGTDSELSKFAAEMNAVAPPDTRIYLASLRYQIVVGQATLFAYIAILALTLLICLAVIVYSLLIPEAAKVPSTTPFPTWNTAANCEVGNIAVIQQQQNNGNKGQIKPLKGKAMTQAAAKMRVKLS